jgi:hypothetical protein
MFGHFVVEGVVVADGVVVVAASDAEVLDAVVDELPAACAITKLPIPDPARSPTESSAVAAILRGPIPRRAGGAGSSGGGGGGANWSSMVCTSLVD